MAQCQMPVGERLQAPDHPSEQQTVEAVAEQAENVDFPPNGPAYDPFHESRGSEGGRNALAHNSDVWPDASAYGNFVPAQHLSHATADPVAAGARLLDAVLAEFPEIHEVGARYCLNKVGGALAWKIGVCEQAVALTIEHYSELVRVPRTREEIGRDEASWIGDGAVDLRFETPDGEVVTVQVKVNVDDPSAQGADYCAALDTESGTVTIHES